MIRPYKPKDTDQIIEVWYQASLIAHPFLSEAFFEQEKINLRTLFLPRAQTWVYDSAGKIEGFICLVENTVGGIFVHPTSQRKGIGSILIDHTSSLHASLELEVFEANHLGRAFYRKYGFAEIEKRFDEPTNQNMLKLRFDK